MRDTSFSGKVALVTGGGSGIGRAAARCFAEAGAIVVVADIDAAAGEDTARMLRDAGGSAHFIQTDVTDARQVDHLVDAAVARFGGLHAAFNNAGVAGRSGVSTIDLDEADWTRILTVNLTSVWLCMRAELRHMVRHGGGVIVNTSSSAGLYAAVNSGVAYAASKHGVIGLTKTAAKEFAGRDIRINAICPAGVATPLLERTIGAQAMAALAQRDPANRIATPEEIARAVLWLCSDAASYTNGQAMLLDGGRFG